jgi:hypothetical protein
LDKIHCCKIHKCNRKRFKPESCRLRSLYS